MLLNTTEYSLMIFFSTIAFMALIIFLLSKIKANPLFTVLLGTCLPVVTALWYNGFMVHNVYFVKDSEDALRVSVDSKFLLGSHLETKMQNGKTIALNMNAYACAVVNESKLTMIAVSQAYSSSLSELETDEGNSQVRISPQSASVVPHAKIDYMPGEDFPENISQRYPGKSKIWGLRIAN